MLNLTIWYQKSVLITNLACAVFGDVPIGTGIAVAARSRHSPPRKPMLIHDTVMFPDPAQVAFIY